MTRNEPTPLTTVIARHARPGKEAAYEQWLEGIIAVSSRFDGHEGVTVLRPAPGSREYVLVVRWRDFESSRRWVESDERAAWLARLEPIAEGEARVEEKCGLETWFTLRQEAPGGPPPPSRGKMAITTLVAIYPLITLLGYVLLPQLQAWPVALRTLVMSAILVPLMTWVVMPRMTRIFWPWLFPGVPRPAKR